jgi:threonine/homoserine/homoserine lactone efflux protein
MPLADYLALLALATAMAFTPGPNTTLAAAIAANRGLAAALRFCAAVPVGWLLLMLAASLGVGGLLAAEPALRGAIKWAGLAYLVWLAWRLSRAGAPGQADDQRLDVGFVQGVLLQFVNIKAWLAALLIAAGWVAPGPLGERLLVVLPTLAFFAFSSNFSYALLGAWLRRWLQTGQRLRWFNRAMAGVLLATAAWMTGA